MCLTRPICDLREFNPPKFYKIIAYYKVGDYLVDIFSPLLANIKAAKSGWYTPYAGAMIRDEKLDAEGDVKFSTTFNVEKGKSKTIILIEGGVLHGYYDHDAALKSPQLNFEHQKLVEVQCEDIIAYNHDGEFVCKRMIFNPDDLIIPEKDK